MASIRKSLSAKVDANGMAQVMFFVEQGRKGKRFRVKSGVFVYSQYWNEKKHALTIPQKIDTNLKRELQNLRDRLDIAESRTIKVLEMYGELATKEFIETILENFKDYEGVLTRDVINEAIQAQNEEEERKQAEEHRKAQYLFNFCQPFFDAKQYSIVRARMMKSLFRSMERFEIFRNQIAKCPFVWNIDDVTRDDIEELFTYFADEHLHRIKYKKIFDKHTLKLEEERKTNRPEKIEERGENRLVDMRKGVKAVWNWLITTRRTTNNPLVGVEIGVQKYGTPYFLTIAERNQVADFDLSDYPELAEQRDIFVFQCFVGCRVGDLTTFTPANIVGDMLVYTPHKTKDETESFTVRVPLTKQAKALIKKYEGADHKGRLFPFIADQNYNEAIKKILTTCEITRKVSVRNPKTGENEMLPINEIGSSHMARRTFVGNAYKLVKDPNIIGSMSGHVEGSKAFARYRDIDDDTRKDVVKMME